MSRVTEMISALRKCAKEHENEVVCTGQIMTSSLCKAVADYLEADKWHYPSKGEYPKEDEDVVALVKAGKKMLKGIGVYINQEWAIRHREEMWLIEPYAWQYIIPPKEEA